MNLFSLRSRRHVVYLLICILSCLLVLCSAMPALAQTTVTWEDLQTHSAQLRNPYEQLTTAQTYQLSNLYQLREWVKANQPEPDSYERQELQRLEDLLAAEGLNVDELLKEAEVARAYWAQKSRATNSEITNRAVVLDGYILPLEADAADPQIDEFLLVPYVGACVHVPAPPPNQMVYIKVAEAVDNPGIFSPVQVEGKLLAYEGSYELFQVDGTRTVDVSYKMNLSAIAPAVNQPVLPSRPSGSLLTLQGWRAVLQALPAQISNTLTTALNQIQTQNSPQAFAFALLLSFSYGVLHTLGPGHGKAVIVSYFVGEGGSFGRGLRMGGQIAVFHVLSATLIVIVTDSVIRQVGGASASSYRIVQLISYGAIALLGAWMLRQTLRAKSLAPVQTAVQTAPVQTAPVQTAPVQTTVQTATVSKTTPSADNLLYPSLSQQIQPNRNNELQSSPNNDWLACGCAACDGSNSMSNWLALAVGAVPCSGALLVLLYGLANDMLWQSVMMVMAISVGMALTLAWIGITAIMMHRSVSRSMSKMAQRRGQQTFGRRSFAIAQLGRAFGASCVCLVGVSLFALTWVSGT